METGGRIVLYIVKLLAYHIRHEPFSKDRRHLGVGKHTTPTDSPLPPHRRRDTMDRMARTKPKPAGKWSGKVTRESHALALEAGVFKLQDPAAIARSLKKSAEASRQRKSDPYRSAMSMLSF